MDPSPGFGALPLSPSPMPSAPFGAPGPPASACRACGAGPAIQVTFHQTIGLILLVRMKTFRGTYCRDCGIAVGNMVTRKTMVTGWLGIVAPILNVVYLIGNARQIAKLKKLPAPVRLSAPPQSAPPQTA